MSVNRRRWSNDLVDSLMSFQSKGSSQLMDSLDYSESKSMPNLNKEKCTNITSALEKLNINDGSIHLEDSIESSTSDRIIKSSDNNNKKIRIENDNVNVNINDDFLNKSLIEENYSRNSNVISDQFDHIFDLSVKPTEDNYSYSSSDTVKLSSSSSNSEITLERQSINSNNTQNSMQISNICTPINNLNSNGVGTKNSANRNHIKVPPDYSTEFSTKEKLINNSKGYSAELSIETITDHQNLNKIARENIDKSSPNIVEFEPSENMFKYNLIKTSKEGHHTQRFFSSPLEHSENNEDLITEMDKPDVWDALLALDRALSPFEEYTQNSLEKHTDPPNILARLSQKFKKTPTKFTEKLVSIIEDSIISLESPTKQLTGDSSGISLHRMTGEFRKLCKFVEDESMPELAPSLTSATGLMLDKTETPGKKDRNEISMIETPKKTAENITKITSQEFISKAFKCFATPKSKAGSNSNTPIKRFTPTADKSFEYWEKICNMMCENQSNVKKNPRKSLYLRESSKVNMNEMLSICERQLASLNDSNIDIRSSDPCKKTHNKTERTVITPRSKSVSKIQSTNVGKPFSLIKSRDKHVNKKLIQNDDHELHKINNIDSIQKELFINDITPVKGMEDSSITAKDVLEKHFVSISDENLSISKDESLKSDCILLHNKHLDINEQEPSNNHFSLLKEQCLNSDNSFQKDFNILSYSPNNNEDRSKESIYDTNEQDCSLLIELAKRRQRCLDTAKLMLEIDREDPIANEDKTCLETLYKLGIQDEAFTNVEDDTKFLNTLNQCLEYQSYFKNKSEPIINMFQKLNSPDYMKSKTSSMIQSQKLLSEQKHTKLDRKTLQNSSTKKLCSKPRTSTKCTRDKMIPSKSSSKIKPKCLEKEQVDKSSLLLKPKQCKLTTQEGLKLQVKTPRLGQTPTIIIPKATPKTTSKIIPKTTPKATLKMSLEAPSIANQRQLTPKITPKSIVPKDTATPKNPVDETSPTNRKPVTPRPKLFLTPGKDPSQVPVGRKKPATYFSIDGAQKVTPQKITFDNVKSPISLYIKSTDTDLVQNVHGKNNDRFLTPVTKNYSDKNPNLKFKLSSKENSSPVTNFNENIILPEVNYQSATKVRLIDDKTLYSPNLIPSHSKTRKLLEPLENKVVIRHERRFVEAGSESDYLDAETSIRVQKVAEKASSIRNKFL